MIVALDRGIIIDAAASGLLRFFGRDSAIVRQIRDAIGEIISAGDAGSLGHLISRLPQIVQGVQVDRGLLLGQVRKPLLYHHRQR